MNTYTTSGRKPIKTETIKEAASTFAGRMARAEFGRHGHCRTCTIGIYARDGSLAEFSAFIGTTKGHETTGHNVSFTVFAS